MTSFQKAIIETKIQGMEGGIFQELMLRFLPLYDVRYTGMIRNGHTPFGKTKAGVPDLIKTFENGDQVGCECGTGEDYWQPTKELSNWKPIEDAEKALKVMTRPLEIVLASSRPFPSNHPNVKTTIHDYLIKKKEDVKISFFSSADLSSWLADNLKNSEVFALAKEFFPEATENELLQLENQALQSAIDYSSKFGLPTVTILSILKAAGFTDQDLLEQKIASALLGNDGRFTIETQGKFSGIPRCVQHLPQLLLPLGNIFQLLGVPKIGKTSVCLELIELTQIKYKWLCAPLDEDSLGDFVDSLLVSIYSQFLSPSEAVKKVKKQKSLVLEEKKDLEPILFIVEDAHLLKPTHLRRVDEAFKEMKSSNLMTSIGIILMTNKNLNSGLSSLTSTIVAPLWTSGEIKDLIAQRKIEIKDPNPEQYYELLCAQSNGHPLFAIALATRHKDSRALILNKIDGPGVQDFELSSEIKNVLYNDILPNADQQNFIQRLAVLNNKSDSSVLEAIRKNVQPQILSSVRNLIDSIGPAVLDGSVSDGLKVNSTFREIAVSAVSQEEKTEVFATAGDALVKFTKTTIQADKWIDGIFYLFMGAQMDRAAASALLLIQFIGKESTPDSEEYLKYVLDRFFYFRAIKLEALDPFAYTTVVALRLLMNHFYMNFGNAKEAAQSIRDIDAKKIRLLNEDAKDFPAFKEGLIVALVVAKLLSLSDCQAPHEAVCDYYQFVRGTSKDVPDDSLNSVVPDLICRLPDNKLKKFNFVELAEVLYPSRISDLASIAIAVGFRIKDDESIQESIFISLNTGKIGSQIFAGICKSSMLSDQQKQDSAIFEADKIKDLLQTESISLEALGGRFYQHYGDALYGAGKFAESISAFELSSDLAPPKEDFFHAWNKFKIGLASDDDQQTTSSLKAAIKQFVSIKNYQEAGKAYGALAAHYLVIGSFAESIKIGLILAEWYHKEKRSNVGGSLRLLCAQILRVEHDILGLDLPEDAFMKPNKKFYLTMAPNYTPEGGGAITYTVISRLARVAKEKELEILALKNAIYSEVIISKDKKTLLLSWYSLCEVINYEDFDEFETTLLLKKLLSVSANDIELENILSQSLFKIPLEKCKEEPLQWGPIVIKIEELTNLILSTEVVTIASSWGHRLNYASGMACLHLKQTKKAYTLLRKAASEAISNKDWAWAEPAAFTASFQLWTEQPSIVEAGKSCYELFLAIEGLGLPCEKVKNFGLNLYRFWSRYEWKKWSTDDIHVREYLYKGAAALSKSNIPEDESGSIMIALLLKAFDFQGPSSFIDLSENLPKEVAYLLKLGDNT